MSAETSTVARRDMRLPTPSEGMNRVLWAALSTIGVVLAGVVLLIALSLLSWATDRPDGASAGSAAQVGLQAWYLAHSVALPASWGALSVPPLLVTGYIVLLFYRAGRGAVRSCQIRTPAEIAETVAAMAITYVTSALVLSSVAYPSPPLLSVWQIIAGAGVLSIGASLAGILRETGHGARLVAMLPGPSYAYTRGALAAFWALAAMSALAVLTSLLLNFSEASAVTSALSPDGLGGLSVVGISIAFVPNAMLLATALGSGAGFTLGTDSLYSLGAVDREALPLFPLFAALPHSGGGLTLLVVVVPLVAGVVGALTLTRHLEPEHRTANNLVAAAAMASFLTAVGVLLIAVFASGGLGDGRLAEMGAAPLRLAWRLFLVMGLAMVAVAFVATRRSLKPASVARRQKALSVLETKTPADDSPKRRRARAGKGATVEDAERDPSGDGTQSPGADSAKDVDPSAGSDSGGTGAPRKGVKPSKDEKPGKDAKPGKGEKPGKADVVPTQDVDPDPTPDGASKRAPAASLSVVKRARQAQRAGATSDKDVTSDDVTTEDGATTEDGVTSDENGPGDGS